MFDSIIQFFSPWHRQSIPVTSFLLVVGISAIEAKPALSNTIETKAMPQTVVQASSPTHKAAIVTDVAKQRTTAPSENLPKADGVYLYGQSPEPEQLGQEYVVFEAHQGKVIGAFYLPQSEFSCFQGALRSGELSLMIAATPDAEDYPDPVAAQNAQQVASASDKPLINNISMAYPYTLTLQNYHQLSSVSTNDQRILETCKANY